MFSIILRTIQKNWHSTEGVLGKRGGPATQWVMAATNATAPLVFDSTGWKTASTRLQGDGGGLFTGDATVRPIQEFTPTCDAKQNW